MHTLPIPQLLQFKTWAKLISLTLLVALADFLFYSHGAGWTLGLFGLLSVSAGFLHNQRSITANPRAGLALLAALGLAVALMDNTDFLTQMLYGFTVLTLALILRNPDIRDIRAYLGWPLLCRIAAQVAYIVAVSIFALSLRMTFFSDSSVFVKMLVLPGVALIQLSRDALIMANAKKRSRKMSQGSVPFLKRWLMPLVLSALFITLFNQANPIVTRWLDLVNWDWIAQYLSPVRMLFWLCLAAFCWMAIRPSRLLHLKARKPSPMPSRPRKTSGLLFNEHSVFTALIAFNGLFLIQNLLDVAFLWSGAALPSGMTYAQYAHQGAYPLVATALLAALFVLIALKPGSHTEGQPRIRLLVYAWVGQNIFLVFSSIVRLEGYIEEFSLTHLRLAALIWMGLVALGLACIVARIYWRKSNGWLIAVNGGLLYATLYVSCFLSFGSIIAEYNVQHCKEMSGTGPELDVGYLRNTIGIEALPALLRYQAHIDYRFPDYGTNTALLRVTLANSLNDWRRWTFRDWRINREGRSLSCALFTACP